MDKEVDKELVMTEEEMQAQIAKDVLDRLSGNAAGFVDRGNRRQAFLIQELRNEGLDDVAIYRVCLNALMAEKSRFG